MNKRTYWIVISLITVLFGSVIYLLVKSLPTGVISGIIGGCIAALLMKGFILEAVEKAVQDAVSPVKPKSQNLEIVMSGLVQLNIRLRTGEFDQEIIKLSESIIDMMIELVPEMAERYSGEELTWETIRMAEEHFPNLIEKYDSLTASGRSEQRIRLLESLSAMGAELKEIGQLVRDHQNNEFERKAATVRMKYGTSIA